MKSEKIFVLCLIYFFILLKNGAAGLREFRPSATDFKRHTVVRPLVQHTRTKRHISTTKHTSGAHHSEVTIRVPVDGEELILDLQLNLNLVTDNHVLTYQNKGKTVLHKPKKQEIDLCHYGGTVRDKPGSWVALSTCHGVQGIVFDGQRMRYIEPQGGNITSQHYMYDHSDLAASNRCGFDARMNKSTYYKPQYQSRDEEGKKIKMSRYKRQVLEKNDRAHAPYNANSHSRYVELVLVADYGLYNTKYKRNIHAVHLYMNTIANIINQVFSQLNIFIALVDVVIWNQSDKIYLTSDPKQTLDAFLAYRSKELLKHKITPNDCAILVTEQRFSGAVVGEAYTSVMCDSEKSGAVATHHTDVAGLQAMTVAHELGHNFGMNHDGDLCECPGKTCIMAPSSTSIVPIHWSTCSRNAVALSFSKGLDYCLRNEPKYLFHPDEFPTCGNGFVERGEDCDCGTTLVPGEYNPCHACCDPETCMLRANATCGAGMCCDLQTCRPKSVGTVCRDAKQECDLPEYCTGHSGFCPDDLYKMDTMPCGSGEQSAFCVRGECRSHSSQCQLLWGITGKPSDHICYQNNIDGNLYGNCGSDQYDSMKYKMCARADVMCGRLHCTHLVGKTSFNPTHVITGLRTISQVDKIIQCHVATINMGLNDPDPGLVPDGAKCGEQMMCLNQRCVSVEEVRLTNGAAFGCPANCSGHGVCNSAGQCHCEAGFAPPLCDRPGAGGSDSSGPMSDTSAIRNFMVAMYVIFLGIIPLILLILFLMYCLSLHNFDKFKVNPKAPTVIHNNLSNNPVSSPKMNVVIKSSSVICANTESRTEHYTLVHSPTSHFPNPPKSPIYANSEIVIIEKSVDKVASSNSQNTLEVKVSLPKPNVTNAKLVHSADHNIQKTRVGVMKNELGNKPENSVNLFNVKLRNTQTDKTQPPAVHKQNKSDNTIDLSNVKLRKASGNVAKLTNVLNDSSTNMPPSKPVKNINGAKTQMANNKEFKFKATQGNLTSTNPK